jgi:hypothetical protein
VSTRLDEASADAPERKEAFRDFRPWREVGWIFKDGGALAIERQGERIRARAESFSHLREE